MRTSTGRRSDQYWLLLLTSTTSRRDQYWSLRRPVLMKEKTKCSGEVGRMSWSISELRVQGSENELR